MTGLLQLREELRIVFIVKEFDRSRTFYDKNFSVPVLSEWDRGPLDKGVVYALGNTQLELLKGESPPMSEGFYVYIEVEDVDALWKRLSHSVEVVDAIATQPWGHRNFSIKDPSGFKLKFFSKVSTSL